MLDEGTDPWGVKVERVEIKDIRLPHMLMRSMAAEAEAVRKARAAIIASDGEKKASKSYSEAAELLCLNPITVQLRYLQTLTHVAMERYLSFLTYSYNWIQEQHSSVTLSSRSRQVFCEEVPQADGEDIMIEIK